MDLKTNSKLEAESMMNTIHFTQLSFRINYFPGVPDNGHGVVPDIYMDETLAKKDQEAFLKRHILD